MMSARNSANVSKISNYESHDFNDENSKNYVKLNKGQQRNFFKEKFVRPYKTPSEYNNPFKNHYDYETVLRLSQMDDNRLDGI